MSKVIVYPIETTKRELEGVFLVAAKLATKGHKVFIGPKYVLDYRLKRLKPEIYIGTRADETNFGLLKTLKNGGCRIVIVDTEGGIMLEEQYKTRHYKPGLSKADLFFAWGARGAAIINGLEALPANATKISGAPWFDMNEVKPFYNSTVRLLKSRFPKSFILFNSRLSFPNHKSPNIAEAYKAQAPEEFEYYQLQYNNLIETVRRLALDFPDELFVVRAHPSEDPSYYFEYFKGLDNVLIEDTFSSRAWVLASKLVLHNSCTTGLEAAMMGVPTIAYMEVNSQAYDKSLPNLASMPVFHYQELKEAVAKIISAPAQLFELNSMQIKSIKEYFHNVDCSASDIITDDVDALETFDFVYKPGSDYRLTKIKMDIIYRYPFWVRFFPPKLRRNLLASKKYFKGKFQSLELEQLNNLLAEWETLRPTAHKLSISECRGLPHTFCIELS